MHLKNLFPKYSENLETFSQVTLGGGQGLKEGEQKVLGIIWHATTDQIIFTLGKLAEQARGLEPTKRNIVSVIGNFYDPMRFLSPIVVKYKVSCSCYVKQRLNGTKTYQSH